MAAEATDATFEEKVLNQKDRPVLVDFWAPWCGPCRMLGPIIDGLATKADGKADVYKLNVDENQATAQKYGITSIPAVLIFKNGELAENLVGVQQEHVYVEKLGVEI